MIKILIVDDHRMFADGLRSILEGSGEYSIECAGNSTQALDLIYKQSFQIAIMDIQMPGSQMNGAELTTFLHKEFPEIRVLIVSMNKSTQLVDELVKAGAMGYVIKDSNHDILLDAIKALQNGRKYWDRKLMDIFMEEKRIDAQNEETSISEPEIVLTRREKDVLSCLAEGLSSKTIGERLFIGSSTVDTHRKNLISKFSAKNSTEVVTKAKDLGII